MADLCPRLAGALAGAFGTVTFTFSLIKAHIERGLVSSPTLADKITVTSTAPTPQPTYAMELPSGTDDPQFATTLLMLLVGLSIVFASIRMLFEFVDTVQSSPPPVPFIPSRTRHIEISPINPARPPPFRLSFSSTKSIDVQPLHAILHPPSLSFSPIIYMDISPLLVASSTKSPSIPASTKASAPNGTKNEKQYLKSLDPSSIRSKQKRNEQRKHKQLEWAAAHPNGIE